MTILRKIVSINLIIALIVCSISTIFASDITTPPAFSFNENIVVEEYLSDSKANDGGGTRATTIVKPETSTQAYRYWNGNHTGINSTSTTSFTVSSFADIVLGISNSIAYSFAYLGKDLSTISNQIAQIASQGGSIVSLASPWQPYFMPASDYDFNSSEWRYYWRRRLMNNSSWNSQDVYNTNWLGLMKEITEDFAGNLAVLGRYLISNGSRDAVLNLYSEEDPTVYTDTGVEYNAALWKDIRLFGTDVSRKLAKITYVLSNQADVALKQAEESNVTGFKNNFTTGTISMSSNSMGDAKGVINNVKTSVSSNATISDGTAVLNSNSDAWIWFTTQNANAFDSTSSNRSSVVESTPYLDVYERIMRRYVN